MTADKSQTDSKAMAQSPQSMLREMERIWIHNNISFLARYWTTAQEALHRVRDAPHESTEFSGSAHGDNPSYVTAVVGNHLENHNYAGVLLAYAILDEFMTVLLTRLGKETPGARQLSEIGERGVRKWRRMLEECAIQPDSLPIEWVFLRDFAEVRHAIVHANGNSALLKKPKRLKAAVERRGASLGYKHRVRLVVEDDFVSQCILQARGTALAIVDCLAINASDRQ